MAALDALKVLYTDYGEKVRQVRAKASPLDGMFGFGNDPRNHSCHEDFYEAAEAIVNAFAQSGPTPAEAYQVVSFMLREASLHREEESYWYLYAVQGHTRCLIPLLTREDCCKLRDFFDRTYPKRDRLPVQKDVYRLLLQYAGQPPQKPSFLQKLLGKKQ